MQHHNRRRVVEADCLIAELQEVHANQKVNAVRSAHCSISIKTAIVGDLVGCHRAIGRAAGKCNCRNRVFGPVAGIDGRVKTGRAAIPAKHHVLELLGHEHIGEMLVEHLRPKR